MKYNNKRTKEMNLIPISKFTEIQLKENSRPLIICDIDNTFIRPKNDYLYYYNQEKHNFSDPNELHKMIIQLLHDSLTMGFVKQTDQEGFLSMMKKVEELNGKLLFLTARNIVSHKKTLVDLEIAGLANPEQYEIHYTNNEITKGQYIKRHSLLHGYDHWCVIDDYEHYLESVYKLFPEIDLYLFKYAQLRPLNF